MEWTRAKDWLIGALGMVLLLGIAVVVLWWVVSDPAGEPGAEPSPQGAAGEPPAAAPPAGLGESDVWLADLTFDAGTVIAEGSTLRDVRAVGADVVTGADGLVAGQLSVDATVPFEVIAGELGDGSVVAAADDGRTSVVRTVEVLGREVQVTATGTVEVVAGGIVMQPTSIDVGGPDFLAEGIAAVVRRFVVIEHTIEGLPEGLVLQDVTVQDDGFRATLRGKDVRLAS